jgi:Protein of unknown function (DUF2911)
MKKIFIPALAMMVCCLAGTAQGRFPALDKSPMDMSYYPVNYPILKIQDKANEPLLARVVYSRPQRNGRNVFGELLEYNKVWRLGANEATEIEFYKDVTIGNKVVPKGRYTLYAIPGQDKWSIIVNRDTDIWGAFKYDSNKDIVKVDVPVEKLNDPIEAFSLIFEKGTNGGFLLIAAWENVAVSLPIAVYEKPSVIKKPVKKVIKKR